MKGLELAKEYFEAFGREMLQENFQNHMDRIAVGLCGEGSECFGFDDEISKDHDFEPGFCIFITKDDYEKIGFQLERAYSKLPREFCGYERQRLSPVGGNRHGVIVIDDFYKRFLGVADVPENTYDWLQIPPNMLATATNGEIWFDNLGDFSKIRNILLSGYPRDVLLKKLSAHLIMMAQAGQYNYPRICKRRDYGAAQLAVFEFVKHSISVIYLLNNTYEPYYKWVYKGIKNFKILSGVEESLAWLTENGNDEEKSKLKSEVIEDISSLIIAELNKMNLTEAKSNNLSEHAYSVTSFIKDVEIRNMHIMSGI